MSETFGTLVFPQAASFSHINRDNAYQMKQELVEGLFNAIKKDPAKIKKGMFSINDILMKGDYIGISTFGDEWEDLVQQLYESSLCQEVYAALFTEYGGHYFYAKNAGVKHDYFYDEDGDDQFQVGFDAQKYADMYETHKQKWHEIANPIVVTNFKPVIAFNPCVESLENQSLVEVYTKQQYSQMMQKQLPDMIALLTDDTEDSKTELIKKYLTQSEVQFKKLCKSFTNLHHQILLICFESMLGEEPIKVDDDNTLYYATPLEKLAHLMPDIEKEISFDWLEDKRIFSLNM